MRAFETYRAQRRNEINAHGKRHLNQEFEPREGSRGKGIGPTHILFIPPVRENKRLGKDEIRHKRVVIKFQQASAPEQPEPLFALNNPTDYEPLGPKEHLTSTVA